MKKVFYPLFATITIFSTSCTSSWSTQHESSTTVTYSGRTVFQPNGEEVGAISPNGFFSFNSNNKQIDIKADKKCTLTYQINNGDKTLKPTDEERALIIEAFKYCQANGMINKKSPYVLDDRDKK